MRYPARSPERPPKSVIVALDMTATMALPDDMTPDGAMESMAEVMMVEVPSFPQVRVTDWRVETLSWGKLGPVRPAGAAPVPAPFRRRVVRTRPTTGQPQPAPPVLESEGEGATPGATPGAGAERTLSMRVEVDISPAALANWPDAWPAIQEGLTGTQVRLACGPLRLADSRVDRVTVTHVDQRIRD